MTKKKRRKNPKKQAPTPLPLPEEQLRIQTEGKTSLRLRFVSGKWQGKSTVAWRIALPVLSCDEDNAFLDRLREAFLRYLAKKAETEREEVWFGGMEWSFHREGLLLSVADCPFSQREYRPCALFLFSEEGLTGIRFPSHSSRKKGSEPFPSQASSSAQRQSAGQGEERKRRSSRGKESTW